MSNFNFTFAYQPTAVPVEGDLVVEIDDILADIYEIITNGSISYSFSGSFFGTYSLPYALSYQSSSTESLTISDISINGNAVASGDINLISGATANPDNTFSLTDGSELNWVYETQQDSNIAASNTPINGFYANIQKNLLDLGNNNNFENDPALSVNIFGSAADDTVFGSNENNIISGSGGLDFIRGFAGEDTLSGGDGDDTIYGNEGDDNIQGGLGDDFLNAGEGNDTIEGGDGNDKLYGEEGDDTLIGGVGDDFIRDGSGNDLINAGIGNDDIRIEEGDDIVDAGDGSNFIYAYAGNNTITSGNGNDIIRTDFGNDIIDSGDGDNDVRSWGGNNTITIGSGNDYVQTGDGDDTVNSGLGQNVLRLEEGTDLVDYNAATQGIRVTIERGTDFTGDGDIDDRYFGVENVRASNFDDFLFGFTGFESTFFGMDGEDIFRGSDANETTYGGAGDDDLRGLEGDDVLDGGDGDDFALGGIGNDELIGGLGQDFMRGEEGNDILDGGEGNDRLYGDEGVDTLRGGDGSDLLNGGEGSDTLYGDGGDDRMFGRDGNDTMYGGAGNDQMRGLEGMDTLYGEGGDDTFIFTSDDLSDSIDGGDGTDTLIVSGNDTVTVDLTALNLTNVEVINLANYNGFEVANDLILDAGDIPDISGNGSLRIEADSFDSITVNQLSNSDRVGTVTVDGQDYEQYSINGTDIFFSTNANLTINQGGVIVGDDSFSVDEDQILTFSEADLLSNDTNVQGSNNQLTITSFSSATNGTLTNNNGTLTYDSDQHFNGTEIITYTIENNQGDTDTGEIVITINNVNDAPRARDDDFEAQSGQEITGNLFDDNGNGIDFDIDGDVFTPTQTGTLLTDKGNTIEISADGSFIYTSGNNFIGSDSFVYTINDGNGGTDTATASFAISSLSLPISDIAFDISNPQSSLADSDAINTASSYSEKTFGANFTTGADVTSRQVIYEQGGGTRGFNIHIENGELVYAIYNFAEEDWGYVEITTPVTANTTYTASLSFDGVLPADGTFTAFLDGAQVGQETGVGLLYGHGGDISVGESGGTVIGGSSDNSRNDFDGTIAKIAQANTAIDLSELPAFEELLTGQLITPVMAIEDPEINTIFDDPAINDSGPYAEKTLGARFTTGTDVTSTQVVFEQGGTVRGMNIFIENGEVFIAAWNYAEENWGYKEFSASVQANQTYTISMVLDGALPENGTLTGYLNGSEIGQFNDVGYLYSHPGDIGFEEMVGGSVLRGSEQSGNGFQFTGDLEIIAEYNDAIGPDLISQLDAYLSGVNSSAVIDGALVNANDIYGTVGDDAIDGTGSGETIFGGDGNDTINSLGGDDTLYGGNGDDSLNGSAGNDILYGQDGNDFIRATSGNNELHGDSGQDTIRGAGGEDSAYGGAGDDDIRTYSGDDLIYGDGGFDYIDGGNGNDVIDGGSEADIIKGDDGQDTLIGGAGSDTLFGGNGSDIFGFSPEEDTTDNIQDFNLAEDVLNITDILTGFSGTDISGFAEIIHTGSRFDLRVDRDGGGDNFETIANIYTNISDSTTAQDLFNAGTLVADQTLV